MDNFNVIEILKVGLPGLVFLLSVLSFKLLNREQEKNSPSQIMLKSIKHFMYINIFLAVLTAGAPFIDKKYSSPTQTVNNDIEDVPLTVTLVNNSNLDKDEAVYCRRAKYAGRFLLIADGGDAIQRLAKYGTLPCNGEDVIQINAQNEWDINNKQTATVYVAYQGMKFDLPVEESKL